MGELHGAVLRPAEDLLLIGDLQLVEGRQVVHPTLGDDEGAAGAWAPAGHDRHVRVLRRRGRVARAVGEASHVQGVAVDEGLRLARDAHVALEPLARVEQHLPQVILLRSIDPEQHLLLRALGLLAGAVGRLEGLVRRKVLGHVGGDVLEQRGPEGDQEVDALVGARLAEVLDGRLDVVQVRVLLAAQVDVPLDGAHVTAQDDRLRLRRRSHGQRRELQGARRRRRHMSRDHSHAPGHAELLCCLRKC
mmetsp:Transcript_46821/g.138370  ORF Transcript_46821/g.138370 Transcript_46821/m.138370 type:complete len:248 (+) Transcript_46821:414-1157(+)